MPAWTKKAALERMKNNQELAGVYKQYPLARPIIESAAKLKRYHAYSRISCHYAYKDWMWAAMGHENQAFWTCIHVIDDLLPPDAADLQLEGEPAIYTDNPTLPGLPQLPPRPSGKVEKNGKLVFLTRTLSELALELKDENSPTMQRRKAMRQQLEEIASMNDSEKITKHRSTVAPFECAHCGLIWYGWTGQHTITPEDLTLCTQCWSALDNYIYTLSKDGEELWSEESKGTLHRHSRAWIQDKGNKPLPRSAEKRFHKSIPKWMRSAIDAGMVKTNGQEVYVVYSKGDTAIRADSVDRSSLK